MNPVIERLLAQLKEDFNGLSKYDQRQAKEWFDQAQAGDSFSRQEVNDIKEMVEGL